MKYCKCLKANFGSKYIACIPHCPSICHSPECVRCINDYVELLGKLMSMHGSVKKSTKQDLLALQKAFAEVEAHDINVPTYSLPYSLHASNDPYEPKYEVPLNQAIQISGDHIQASVTVKEVKHGCKEFRFRFTLNGREYIVSKGLDVSLFFKHENDFKKYAIKALAEEVSHAITKVLMEQLENKV